MRIRVLALTTGIVAALAAGIIATPVANAAQLTVAGDKCTITYSENELKASLRSEAAAGQAIVAELKRLLPGAAADINLAIDNGLNDNAVNARIEAAAVAAGFNAGEAYDLLDLALWVRDVDARYAALSEGARTVTLTRTEAARLIREAPGYQYWGPRERGTWSVRGNAVLRNSEKAVIASQAPHIPMLQACVDGRPGTYNVTDPGTGSSGSSGFSFGSS